MKIEDKSKDKKYFTIIPNYIANHSSANDQALYFQMKKIVGDNEDICYASEKYFKDKLKIGSKALKKSIQYLLDHEWIENAGQREIQTKGGIQTSNVYLVKDIWKMNIDYYQDKGVPEREPLKHKGVSESNQRGVQKETKGVAFKQQRRTYNNNSNNNLCENKFSQEDYSSSLSSLKRDTKRHIRIIGIYLTRLFEMYGSQPYSNEQEKQEVIKRHCKSATKVGKFRNDKIIKAMDKAFQKVGEESTLETVYKYLTK